MNRTLLATVLTALGASAAFGACHAASDHDDTALPSTPDGQSSGTDATPPPVVVPADGAVDAEAGTLPGPGCRGVLLPTTQHHVPSGMCASLVARGLGILRQITFAPNGDLLAANKEGSIKRLRDESGDGFFQPAEIVEVAATDGNTNNAHLDTASGYLYAGSPFGVQRWPYSAATGAGPREDVITDLPLGGHFHHAVHVWDGWLYVGSGSVDNCDNPKGDAYDDNRSVIKRFALASFTPGTPLPWASGEVVTDGLRNPNGFARSAAGRVYAVVNGIDSMVYENEDVYEDNPGEQLVEIAKGRSYGFPFCFTAQRIGGSD